MNKLETMDITIIAVLPVISIVLWFLAGYFEKVKSSRWRLCWLAPALITMLLTYIAGFDKLMIPAYLSAAVLLAGLLRPDIKSRRTASAAAAVLAIAALPACLFVKGYHTADYVKDFKKGFAAIKAHYVLSEHKQIDWDALYDKYLPRFEKANEEHDKVLNEIVWNKFCAEFHDLHVCYASDNENMKAANKRAGGNDYGLVITKLADGSFAAVQVDDSLKPLGIHNGTPVISWNGMSPDEADSLSELAEMQNYGDEDNADFYKGFFAAGTGGDTSEIVYLDDDGTEKRAELSKLSDDYYSRFEKAYDTINQGLNKGHMTVTKLNDTTAVLRVKTMSFDSVSEKDKHASMQNELRENILEMKSQGVRDIVIDIRENNGGSGTMVKAITQLFAPEGEQYYVTDAYWDSEKHTYISEGEGKWKTGSDVTFEGENILGDEGRIVLLVTAHSVSAADHLTHVMSSFDNTTVMGFTEPSGSAQGVTPTYLESGVFQFSESLMLNRDGSIFIDSGTDWQSENELDIKVPYDQKALKALFDDGEDYLMDQCLDYLANLER
ncbi:S41 family peptidase [Ruminococcus sp.]|uniref:S41 family peptidase n=1 Tax=Ruminococcus sp. TaxID=41978 RepID=UPI0025FF09A5|nr:S41 family peptidase [Ruminococcus sp.]MBQ8967790.1 peptidase S41 [Ruminococcus sp.]